MEEWIKVPEEYGDYEINTNGIVRNSKTGHIMKPNYNSGYYRVGLKKSIRVHQLMAICFLNHRPNGMKVVVDHINNIRTDNRLENLQIITQKENVQKYYKNR